MGCATSRIDKEERVQVCKQRKRLMKQLVGFRGEFADAQLAYLRALKNTGVTLRQFTESESLDMENTADVFALPPSPPLPLPPSPPPPPPLSPDSRKVENDQKEEVGEEESKEIAQFDTPSSHPILGSSWESWDVFRSSSPYHWGKDEIVEPVEEEDWAETKTEFEEDEPEEKASTDVLAGPLPEKPQTAGSVDDNSSTTSWYAKDTTYTALVLRRSKKTLEGIAKELDDYFLKASAGVKEITVLMDLNGSDRFLPQNVKENKGKKGNTAKVFSALSWSWSSKSLPFTRESVDSGEPCRPGAHCITLKKLLDEETKLYKEVKEEEITKIELEKKSSLLRKQEEENQEWTKTDKTRLSVESLEADLSRLQLSISRTSSSILTLIDDELYPQLVAITSGLLHVWRVMYESHQAQFHISQQLNHRTDDQKMDLSTAYHRQAAAQLESEVYRWYNSFCQVVNFQLEYVRALCRWIKLTDSLKDDHRQSLHSSAVHSFCHQWQLALEILPDKAASEAIKGLCSAIHSIVVQQEEEYSLQRKFEKAEKRLQKELDSLDEMERKLKGSFTVEAGNSNLSPKHPLTLKRTKTEALKKLVADEKVRYLKSVQATKTMTLNNLKTSLPNVFKALMDFSRGSVDAIDTVFNHIKPVDNCEAEVESLES